MPQQERSVVICKERKRLLPLSRSEEVVYVSGYARRFKASHIRTLARVPLQSLKYADIRAFGQK